MTKTREHEVRSQRITSIDVITQGAYGWVPELDDVRRSFSRLPQGKHSEIHTQHYDAAKSIILGAIKTYSQETSAPDADERAVSEATMAFSRTVDMARGLNFPAETLRSMSFQFIDMAFEDRFEVPDTMRQALGDMGTAIGGELTLRTEKVNRIVEHSIPPARSDKKVTLEMPPEKAQLAASMFSRLGVDEITFDPSRVDVITGRIAKAALPSVAATLISASVFAPTAASATETPTSATQNEPGSTNPSELTVLTDSVVTFTEPAKSATAVADVSTEVTSTAATEALVVTNEAQTALPTINPIVAAPSVSVAPAEPVTAITEVETAVVETTIQPIVATTVGVAQAPVLTTSEVEAPVAPTLSIEPAISASGAAAPQEAVATTTVVVAPEVKPIDTQGELFVAVDETGGYINVEGEEAVVKTEDDTPRLDRETATPEQLAIEAINDAIRKDGDVTSAATLIRLYFHDKSIVATSFQNGNPVYEMTNPELVTNTNLLKDAFADVISKKGHGDAGYVNATLTTIAVLNAFANDQSVLNSPDVQTLVAAIKKPTDEYQGKLFDQYVAKAKEALAANDGLLLKGISDQYKPQLETMYAHVLMANISGEQQGVEIQAIKDAEAAEAARKAALEVQQGYEVTAEIQALRNLAERAAKPEDKRGYYVYEFLIAHAGFNATQAAGVLGNLHAESASTFDPGISQYYGGNAKGIAQWEGGRWDNLQRFATERGTGWDNMDTQLAFMLSELPGRRDTLNVVKGTGDIYNAAREFMIRFETPRVVVDALNGKGWGPADRQAQERANRGQPYLDALIAETQVVTAEREAAAKAEAERVAKMGFNMEQSLQFMKIYLESPDSVNYLGGAGRGCNGGPLSNCVSFSVYFVNKYTDLKGMASGAPGHGSTVARNLGDRNPGLERGNTARPFAIFSTANGSQWCGDVKCGHTGVVLGVDEARDVIIIGEAGCSTPASWDTAREYPLSKFNNGTYNYTYTDGHIIKGLLG